MQFFYLTKQVMIKLSYNSKIFISPKVLGKVEIM